MYCPRIEFVLILFLICCTILGASKHGKSSSSHKQDNFDNYTDNEIADNEDVNQDQVFNVDNTFGFLSTIIQNFTKSINSMLAETVSEIAKMNVTQVGNKTVENNDNTIQIISNSSKPLPDDLTLTPDQSGSDQPITLPNLIETKREKLAKQASHVENLTRANIMRRNIILRDKQAEPSFKSGLPVLFV